MPQPEPPVNITIHLIDGTKIPADSTYLRTENGTAIWQLITPVDPATCQRITVQRLPTNTEIRFPIQEGDPA